MTLHFTRRMNNLKMATIHLKFTVGSADLATLVTLHPVYLPDTGELDPHAYTRVELEALVRSEYHRCGSERLHFWTDQVEDDKMDQQMAWAAAVVRREYPELDDQGLREWLG